MRDSADFRSVTSEYVRTAPPPGSGVVRISRTAGTRTRMFKSVRVFEISSWCWVVARSASSDAVIRFPRDLPKPAGEERSDREKNQQEDG